MTDPRDDLIEAALRRLATTQPPSDDEVVKVLERAARPDHRRARIVSAIAAILVAGSVAIAAVPPARAVARDLLGGLDDFFAGGVAPGPPVPANEPPGSLNWLTDATKGSPRILAQRGELRLVAYRQQRTGGICFSVGTSYIECGPGPEWRRVRFAGAPFVNLIVTDTDDPDVRALWGVTDDPRIASVRLSYPHRPAITAGVGANGFVMLVPYGVVPSAMDAQDSTGKVIGQGSVTDSNLMWERCLRPEGCT
jgi:hypothetical protein